MYKDLMSWDLISVMSGDVLPMVVSSRGVFSEDLLSRGVMSRGLMSRDVMSRDVMSSDVISLGCNVRGWKV